MSARARIGSLLTAALLVPLAGGPAAAALLRVPEDHTTIAAALAAASYGDSVSPAVGTYYEHDLVLPPGVALIGRGTDSALCVIDAQQQGRVLYGTGLTRDNTIARVTLRQGLVSAAPWQGGGFYCQGDPVIHSVKFTENSTDGGGGGMYALGKPLIGESEFSNNTANEGGGAKFDLGPDWAPAMEMVDVRIWGNQAERGGGIAVTGHGGVIRGCLIEGNSAELAGGGLKVVDPGLTSGLLVQESLIRNNQAAIGGGVYCHAGIEMSNCTIVGNTASQSSGGGGFYSDSDWDLTDWPTLVRCIVAFNNGGGGISLYEYPQVDVVCCDVFGNIPANYVGWQYDHTGEDGTISADPLFCVDRGPQDYGLQAKSPCLPSGNDCGVLIGAYGETCLGTSVAPLSWSKLKSLY